MLPPAALGLVFDTDLYTSLYTLETPAGSGTANYAFYAQHFPIEFELDSHYLKDEHGEDVEPLFEEPSEAAGSSSSSRRGYAWRNSMIATFLVLLFSAALSHVVYKYNLRMEFAREAWEEGPFPAPKAAPLLDSIWQVYCDDADRPELVKRGTCEGWERPWCNCGSARVRRW